jgi:hypothetical protein
MFFSVGATEGIFYQPVWQVTYYRYLRFYREGQVIYYVGPEEPRDGNRSSQGETKLSDVLLCIVASFFRLDRRGQKSVYSGVFQLTDEGKVQAWA